jgi:hypothetical protein
MTESQNVGRDVDQDVSQVCDPRLHFVSPIPDVVLEVVPTGGGIDKMRVRRQVRHGSTVAEGDDLRQFRSFEVDKDGLTAPDVAYHDLKSKSFQPDAADCDIAERLVYDLSDCSERLEALADWQDRMHDKYGTRGLGGNDNPWRRMLDTMRTASNLLRRPYQVEESSGD